MGLKTMRMKMGRRRFLLADQRELDLRIAELLGVVSLLL